MRIHSFHVLDQTESVCSLEIALEGEPAFRLKAPLSVLTELRTQLPNRENRSLSVECCSGENQQHARRNVLG